MSTDSTYVSLKKLYDSNCHHYDDIFRQYMLLIQQVSIKDRLKSCLKKGYTGFTLCEQTGIIGAMTSAQKTDLNDAIKKRIRHKKMSMYVWARVTDNGVYIFFDENNSRRVMIEPMKQN